MEHAGLGSELRRMLGVASKPIAEGRPALEVTGPGYTPSLTSELSCLLAARNGFFAFESALRVFPAQTVDASYGIADWNAGALWKASYGGLADQVLCFAEDIFGNQFSLLADRVVLFAVETGEITDFSTTINGWAGKLLADYDYLTGYTFARDWQRTHGPLPGRQRLCPITPFVGGGQYSTENMRAVDAAEVMRTFGSFAQRVHGQPDGTRLKLKIE